MREVKFISAAFLIDQLLDLKSSIEMIMARAT